MNDVLRETLQFVLGGLALILATGEFLRRFLLERPKLSFHVTGKANHRRHSTNHYIHQIHIRISNQSRLDNSVSECWLEWQSQTARPPTCRMQTNEIKTVIDGRRIFKVVFPNYEIEPTAIEFPKFIKAHETVEGYVVFSTSENDLNDIVASTAKIRIRDSHSKWYESPVHFSKP